MPLRAILPFMTLLAGACTSSPVAPLPPPLPETLAWAAAGDTPGFGAFLGLKTRENVGGGLESLAVEPGLRVTQVIESSPAAAAGFRVGDVLLAFDGAATSDPATLEALLAAAGPTDEVRLEVQRGDTVFAVTVELRAAGAGLRGASEVRYRADPARSRAGWLTGRGGVTLVSSSPDGPFPFAGVPVRSVVRAIDGVAMHTDRALIRALQAREPGDRVRVSFVDPAGEEREEVVRLQDQDTRITRLSVPVLLGYEATADGAESSFTLLDLWFLSLFHYERQEAERRWSLLRFFRFATGVGELSE